MKVLILQSNYIPWKGYFDMINMADIFVIYDEVQYTKNDWRNRNKVKSPIGSIWLTIPVKQEKLSQKINETIVFGNEWRKKHWNSIKINYSKSLFFNDYKNIFEEFYLTTNETNISRINLQLIQIINKILEIDTNIVLSTEFDLVEGKTEKLVDICKKLNCTEYISGPAAKDYLKEDLFKEQNIKLKWMDYTNYKQYSQLYPPFEQAVSILDLIFNEGQNAKKYMTSFNIN